MEYFHVIPRGDAVTHDTRTHDKCECVVEIKTVTSLEKPGDFEVWIYHRRVSIDEALAEVA